MDVFKTGTLQNAPRGLSYAMGNFDGVHRGHQSVITAAAARAPFGVISFTPHPRRFFKPDLPLFELMRVTDKNHVLSALEASAHIMLDFNQELADLSAADFVKYLAVNLTPSHIAVGRDFHFGHNREGNAQTLQTLAKAHDIDVSIVNLSGEDGTRYSSSAIRDALNQGNPRRAARLLGRPHRISGTVEKGDQRGRELGFPTANLFPSDIMLPKFGIYATRVHILDGPHKGEYLGATSTGVRPTFGINTPNFETYILDFSGDIYGTEIGVDLIEFLRPETKFNGVDALIAQMNADVARVREILGQDYA